MVYFVEFVVFWIHNIEEFPLSVGLELVLVPDVVLKLISKI